ncbi:hypothetical protein AYK20_03950 [Thermoplasmatales archaeon SG8-52-1]|nr:MAG: hypothetical protein AYK20_03950 [Thermoplasmatales archaeon SG8-52-1]
MIKKFRIQLITILIILIIPIFLIYSYYADVEALDSTKVTINDIRLLEIGLTSCDLKIYITFYNPSGRDISELTAVFDIYIANNYVGKGSLSKVSISPQSSAVKDTTVTIYYANVAAAVVDGIKKGNFDLAIKGTASGNVLFGFLTVSDKFEATKPYP